MRGRFSTVPVWYLQIAMMITESFNWWLGYGFSAVALIFALFSPRYVFGGGPLNGNKLAFWAAVVSGSFFSFHTWQLVRTWLL